MLTDFSPQQTTSPQLQSAVTPQEGVSNKGTSTLLTGLGGVFDKASELLATDKKDRAAKIVAEFSSQQLLVADGLEQGTIANSSYARALMRKNLLEAINAHPTLAQDLIAADAALSGLPAGTGVARNGTLEEQRVNAQRDMLVSNGFASPDATDAEFEKAASDWESAQATIRAHNLEMNALEERGKQLTVGTAEYEANKRSMQDLTVRTARSIIPAERTKMQNDFNAIINDTTLSEADKQAAIENYYNKWLGEVAGTLGELPPQDSQYMLKPFEDLKGLYVSRATGEINDAELKRTNERAIAAQTALMLADPEVARFAAASALSKSDLFTEALAGVSSQKIASKVLERVGAYDDANPDTDNPSPYVKGAEDKTALKVHLNMLTEGLNSTDPEVVATSSAQLTEYISMLEQDAGKIKADPAKAIEIVNWLASSSFLKAKTAHPELFGEMDGVIEILKSNYADEVMNLVEEQFTQNHVVTFQDNPGVTGKGVVREFNATDVVVATQTDTGVNFVAINKDDAKAVALAAKLNKELKPVINNTVKAFAHLEGRTDYGNYWGEISGQVLNGDIQGGTGDQRMGGNSGQDRLSMSDFGEPLSVDPNSPVKGGAGWTEVTNPDGQVVRRTGARSWRNNNPGNIEYGTFAKEHGAIGSDGRFAVFPSYEAGRAAKEALLFDSRGYAGKTIEEAINRYAPPSENDSSWYAASVAEAIGVDVTTPLSELSQEQRMTMLDAMQVVEGWRVGKETVVQ